MNDPLTLEEVVRLRDMEFSWSTIDNNSPEFWRNMYLRPRLKAEPRARPLNRSNLNEALERLRLQIYGAQLADEDIGALRVDPDDHRRLDMLWGRWRNRDA